MTQGRGRWVAASGRKAVQSLRMPLGLRREADHLRQAHQAGELLAYARIHRPVTDHLYRGGLRSGAVGAVRPYFATPRRRGRPPAQYAEEGAAAPGLVAADRPRRGSLGVRRSNAYLAAADAAAFSGLSQRNSLSIARWPTPVQGGRCSRHQKGLKRTDHTVERPGVHAQIPLESLPLLALVSVVRERQ